MSEAGVDIDGQIARVLASFAAAPDPRLREIPYRFGLSAQMSRG